MKDGKASLPSGTATTCQAWVTAAPIKCFAANADRVARPECRLAEGISKGTRNRAGFSRPGRRGTTGVGCNAGPGCRAERRGARAAAPA